MAYIVEYMAHGGRFWRSLGDPEGECSEGCDHGMMLSWDKYGYSKSGGHELGH